MVEHFDPLPFLFESGQSVLFGLGLQVTVLLLVLTDNPQVLLLLFLIEIIFEDAPVLGEFESLLVVKSLFFRLRGLFVLFLLDLGVQPLLLLLLVELSTGLKGWLAHRGLRRGTRRSRSTRSARPCRGTAC